MFPRAAGEAAHNGNFLAGVKIVSSLETGQAENVRSAGQSTRSRT